MSEELVANLEIKFINIVDALLEAKDTNGIYKISQYEISYKTGIPQAQVSKVFSRLYKDKCLKKVNQGEYEVLRSDIRNFGPLGKLIRLQAAVKQNPQFIKIPRKEQAKILDMTIEGLNSTYGLIYGIKD